MTQESPKHKLLGLRREPRSEVAVPLPRPRWFSRIVVPGGVILLCLILLLYTARDSLWPATEVRALPVLGKATPQGTRK